METNYQKYRENKFASGLLYQDFIVDCCWSLLGLAIVQYASKEYQQAVGESRLGAEIKHDEKYKTTGNLWIELGEKAQPRPGAYYPSGIERGDNSWLFIIGDYDTVFIFSTRLLQALGRSKRYALQENKTKTSVGFLLPHDDAVKYAAQIIYPNAHAKIGKHLSDLHQVGRELHDAVTNRNDDEQLHLFMGLPKDDR